LILNPVTGEARITIEVIVGDDPKFVRGITKMAFELLAFRVGVDTVMGNEYDPVRDFVMRGIGRRFILWRLNTDNTLYGVPEYTLTDPTGGKAMHFCLFGLEFFVDLTLIRK
jgi:hypothetical protein